MKRILVLIISLLLAVALCACDDSLRTTKSPAEDIPEAEATPAEEGSEGYGENPDDYGDGGQDGTDSDDYEDAQVPKELHPDWAGYEYASQDSTVVPDDENTYTSGDKD